MEASPTTGSLAVTDTFRVEPLAPRSLRSLWLAVGLLVLGAAAVVIPFVPFAGRMALTLTMIGAMMAYLVLRSHETPFDPFESFFIYSVFFIVSYGFGAIYSGFDPVGGVGLSLERYVASALGLAVVGYLAFLAGYGLLPLPMGPSRLAGCRFRSGVGIVAVGLLGFVGVLAGVAQERGFQSGAGASGARSALLNIAFLFRFAWFVAWYQVWSRRGGRTQAFWPVIALAPLAGLHVFLTVGSKENVISTLGFPLMAYWFARRRFPVKAFVVLLLLSMFVVFPLYNTFRIQTGRVGTVEKLERTVFSASKWRPDDYVNQSVFAFLRRLNYIGSTAAVLRDAGRRVDFKYGETLSRALVAVTIPRFLWPEKPSIVIGREFATTFQLVARQDKLTQIAPTSVGEFYWNLHVPGVLLGMALLGFLYRLLYARFGAGGGYDPIRHGIYAVLLPTTIHVEGGIAAALAGMAIMVGVAVVTIALLRYVGVVERVVEAGTGSE